MEKNLNSLLLVKKNNNNFGPRWLWVYKFAYRDYMHVVDLAEAHGLALRGF
jgi:hypothetical protein